MVPAHRQRAVITGASSGIGAACAHGFAAAGFDLLLGARRVDRLEAVAAQTRAVHGVDAHAEPLDVTVAESVDSFAAAAPRCDVLVVNAGGALGLEPIASYDEDAWRWMWEANVLGLARTVRAFVPALVDSGDGRIVVVTSVAGHETYAGGGGYTAAKHAAAAITDTLRLELLGRPVRVTEVAPGMVDTEFSAVRFGGDTARADAVYTGMTPLQAADVADAIVWAATRPSHVTVARLDLLPRDQASARDVHRTTPPR
ncbi:MAG: Serine 3-dehydrogenase [Frankiales bacterium]|nr:Serine 3-dehydrogenase [Frankiales bacterium]